MENTLCKVWAAFIVGNGNAEDTGPIKLIWIMVILGTCCSHDCGTAVLFVYTGKIYDFNGYKRNAAWTKNMVLINLLYH